MAGEALFAEFVPAEIVFTAVFFEFLIVGVMRPVGSGVGEIEEERLVLFSAVLVLVDESDGVVSEGIRRVEVVVGGALWLGIRGVSIIHDAPVIGMEEVGGTADAAVVTIESALERPIGLILAGEVPFAGHEGGVARRLGDLCESDTGIVDVSGVGGVKLFCVGSFFAGHVADADLMRVKPGQQGGAGGAAAGGVVELGETQTTFSERVKIRRCDVAAVATKIGIAKIIRKDDKHIRAAVLRLSRFLRIEILVNGKRISSCKQACDKQCQESFRVLVLHETST